MVILAGSALGVAQLFTLAAASTRDARSQTWAETLAADKIEQLRALSWAYDASGQSLSDTTSDVSTEPATSAGHGLAASPVDSLERATDGYVDYLDASGQWVGTGGVPPAKATYVRRWSIQPLSGNPANTLVLQVLVTTMARGGVLTPSGSHPARRPGDALIVNLRTRKAR